MISMKMKNIGIVTYCYKNYNYGGVLQAYALTKHINDKTNFSAMQIYVMGNLKSSYNDVNKFVKFKRNGFKIIAKGIQYRIKSIISRKNEQNVCTDIRKEKFDIFIKKIPNKIYTQLSINESNSDFDYFISGSDQVWNIDWEKDIYFLDFTNDDKKRIAYAASIGKSKLSDSEINFMLPLIERFNYISVREEKAKVLIENSINTPIEVVLDPVFLLSNDEWEESLGKKLVNTKYIFVYLLGENSKHKEKAMEIAKIKNLKIVDLSCDYKNINEEYNYFNTGPYEFINLLKYSEIVITDSFHGCAFSLIFNKNFYALKRHSDKKRENMNSRLYNLFNIFNLENRFIDEIDVKYIDQEIDIINYSAINEILHKKKREAETFLSKSLSSNE